MTLTRIRTSLVLVAAFASILVGVFLAASQTAYANEFPAWDMKTTTSTGPSFATCPNLKNWAPNADEDDRWPTATVDGLEFSNTDLVHHETDVKLADLKPGSFVAHPAPDQPSFFSVEVSGSDGKYGTLRWNPSLGTSGEWEATSQNEQHHDPDPVTLADAFPIHLSHQVVRFGVGYTEHPAGTVTTVVSSVTFGGHTYDLTCQPKTETSSPAPHTSSTSPAPHTSKSSSHPAGAVTGSGTDDGGGGGALPITGPSVSTVLFIAAGLLAAGAVILWLIHRRRVRFTA